MQKKIDEDPRKYFIKLPVKINLQPLELRQDEKNCYLKYTQLYINKEIN
jgi:hypothetical protein